MSDNKPNVVPIKGGKKRLDADKAGNQNAKLLLGGEEIVLDAFVLSGVNEEGKRILMTWNCSLDTMLSYAAVLNVVIQERLKDAISE